ncbi:hypothetical protein TBR22_A30190 [Luteitalea sp. TBR-22]|uniref:sensor histidine kinase n=1 Tax=Luteitalea sp. TBR-22 TaxID=2802971 RepID=UPI001AF92718|nr:HAMP domain-containing sensor histidine kinase [Luteitalea sp. TBR-22]BCS33792.1 hypothetical protein TBR22_A30190 [Luteitalea sp. TBR-22]
MTLRTRLAVTSLGVLVPLAALLTVVADRARHRGMEDTVQRLVSLRLQDGGDVCGSGRVRPEDAPPPAPPGGPPGPAAVEFLGYDARFTPLAASAPALTDDQRDALAAGRTWSGTWPTPAGAGIALAFPAPTGRRCAFAVARLRPRPGVRRDQLAALAVSLVGVLGATWLAAGPVLTRLKALTAAVHASAQRRYAAPIVMGGRTDEITDLAAAFNAAGASVRAHLLDVEARGETLREFVANTTHDIAVPLSALQGHLAALESDAALGDQARRRVRHAVEEAHYLGSLLRNLGAAARLDGARAVERHPVDLVGLVERVVVRLGVLARAREVTLQHGVPAEAVTTITDLTLLEQALGNLVDNAIQYNRPGGHVAVVLDCDRARYTLTVLDDGPGIPADDLDALLTARSRGADARTRRPDGQGLGLAIVADAARLLDLTLAFDHPIDGGLRVTITGSLDA